jgi:hypothetical protein
MKHPVSSVPATLLVLTFAAACADPAGPPAALDPDQPSLRGPGTMELSSSESAERSYFFEETAEAFWAVPHECADGSTVQATLLVRATRDFEAPDTEDANPTVRVQYQAVCPDGSSYSWLGAAIPATVTSSGDLTSVTATGAGSVRDHLGVTHQVTFDVTWTGDGRLETTVRTTSNQGFRINTSMRKQREATATGVVTFDGNILVDGAANHPTRPAPFIRTDEERTTRPPSN